MTPQNDSSSPKPQIDKFRELARELECDDDEAAFDEKLKRIAKAKPLSIEEMERRLALARAEAIAWKGKDTEHYTMAVKLVENWEGQLREASDKGR